MLRVNVYDWDFSGAWKLIGFWFKAECGHWHYNDIQGRKEQELRERRFSHEFMYHRPINFPIQASLADISVKGLPWLKEKK